METGPGTGQSVGGGRTMTALERFLHYVTYDTQSSETSETR